VRSMEAAGPLADVAVFVFEFRKDGKLSFEAINVDRNWLERSRYAAIQAIREEAERLEEEIGAKITIYECLPI
jgi:hypothetical protein